MSISNHSAGALRSPSLASLASLFAALIWSLPAQASVTDGFDMQEFPLFTSESVLVAYDVDTDTLNARSFAVTLDLLGEGTLTSINGSGFSLNGSSFSRAASGLPSRDPDSGTIEIFGLIPDLGATSGVLLEGAWIDIEFLIEGALIDILVSFEVTGGDLADMFGPLGVVALTGSGFAGDFGADWANDGTGTTVTAPAAIPLPAGLWLLGTALFGLVPAVRRRAR